MKKSLVALAALAATTAFAQSSVTLYGNMDQSVFRSSADAGWMLSSNSNGGSTSLWGITGKEDLGGGTTVSFDLKSELSLATGSTGSSSTGVSSSSTVQNKDKDGTLNGTYTTSDYSVPMFNRGAWVGIANKSLGDFKIGRQNDAWWETGTQFNNTGINSFGWANATAAVSGTAASQLAALSAGKGLSVPAYADADATKATTGSANQTWVGYAGGSNPASRGTGMAFYGGISYATPVINGFQFKFGNGVPKAGYTTHTETNNLRTYSLNYKNGPLTAAWATTNTNFGNESGIKNTLIGVKYVMGQYTFTAAQNQTRLGTAVLAAAAHDADVRAFGVGYAMNAKWNLDVGYTTTSDKIDTANKFTQTGVTAKYAFSKRTTWYVGYGKGKNEGVANYGTVYAGGDAPGKGLSTTAIITGLRHQF